MMTKEDFKGKCKMLFIYHFREHTLSVTAALEQCYNEPTRGIIDGHHNVIISAPDNDHFLLFVPIAELPFRLKVPFSDCTLIP